jgi:hypothetical protein
MIFLHYILYNITKYTSLPYLLHLFYIFTFLDIHYPASGIKKKDIFTIQSINTDFNIFCTQL